MSNPYFSLVRFVLPILLFSLHALISPAQKATQWLELGDKALEEGNYIKAHEAYRQAFILDSSNFDITVKYATGLRLVREYKMAAQYYEKIYRKDHGKLYPEGQFWLATMQQLNGAYLPALKNFKKFYPRSTRLADPYYQLKTQQQIKSCEYAIQSRTQITEGLLNGLDAVNSSGSELAPYYSSFDSSLYFFRIPSDRDTNQSDHVQGFKTLFPAEHIQSVSLAPPLYLPSLHLSNLSYSPTGKQVYLTLCEDQKNCAIYTADVIDGHIVNLRKMPKINDSGSLNSMPSMALIDGKEYLFFVSDRKGGYGKLDIWYCLLDGRENSTINAGPLINSIDQEISPFYSNGHLYFSSDWHEGFGGFDIFRATGSPGHFSASENLKKPINSSLNDYYYAYSPDLEMAFFASNRPISETSDHCCNDLYSFQFSDSLKKNTEFENLESLNKYLPVTLYFHNDEPNPNSVDTSTNVNYLEAYAHFISLRSRYIEENSDNQDEESTFLTESFFTFYVEKGMQDLMMFSELLLKSLEQGQNIELSIKGFASPRAKNDYNLNLTRRRTASLVNYLKAWNNGVLLLYMNTSVSEHGGRLTINELPFGENLADPTISDLLEDEKSSIYSVGACLERKIEIVSVEAIPIN